jgi:hypothetical protein
MLQAKDVARLRQMLEHSEEPLALVQNKNRNDWAVTVFSA